MIVKLFATKLNVSVFISCSRFYFRGKLLIPQGGFTQEQQRHKKYRTRTISRSRASYASFVCASQYTRKRAISSTRWKKSMALWQPSRALCDRARQAQRSIAHLTCSRVYMRTQGTYTQFPSPEFSQLFNNSAKRKEIVSV